MSGSPQAVGSVVVVGSANADLVVQVDRRPDAGETLIGSDLVIHPGGKGANQAAAAARAGGSVRFVGNVGTDAYADVLRGSLVAAGVDIEHLAGVEGASGTAIIVITPDGENSIVVSPGANAQLDCDRVDAVRDIWADADVLVLQLEVPIATVEWLALGAHGRVVLNAAPAQSLPARLIAAGDPLVVNRSEATLLLGDDARTEVPAIGAGLLELGARSVVITLGSAGSVVVVPGAAPVAVPGFGVDAVDTTGAGDAFVGATAARLAAGDDLLEAVRFATAMSALSVQRPGAQSSYPDRAQVLKLMSSAG